MDTLHAMIRLDESNRGAALQGGFSFSQFIDFIFNALYTDAKLEYKDREKRKSNFEEPSVGDAHAYILTGRNLHNRRTVDAERTQPVDDLRGYMDHQFNTVSVLVFRSGSKKTVAGNPDLCD
jgi:hypothetical protein